MRDFFQKNNLVIATCPEPFSQYWSGVLENLEMLETNYPDWLVRLHVSREKITVDGALKLCQLQCSNPRSV